MGVGTIGRNAVRARQHRRGEIGDGCRVSAHIGALVVKYLILERENASVWIDGGANVMVLLARMVGGDEVLAAVLDPFDWPLHA